MRPEEYTAVLRHLDAADADVIKDILGAYFAQPRHERPRDLATLLLMSVLEQELRARVAELQARASPAPPRPKN
jgi:hypothetical protein